MALFSAYALLFFLFHHETAASSNVTCADDLGCSLNGVCSQGEYCGLTFISFFFFLLSSFFSSSSFFSFVCVCALRVVCVCVACVRARLIHAVKLTLTAKKNDDSCTNGRDVCLRRVVEG